MPIFPPQLPRRRRRILCAGHPEYASLRDLGDRHMRDGRWKPYSPTRPSCWCSRKSAARRYLALSNTSAEQINYELNEDRPHGRIERSVIVTEYGFVLLGAAAPQS